VKTMHKAIIFCWALLWQLPWLTH